MRTGGQMIVEALSANGIDRAFGVPGESYLAVLDALYDSSNQIHLTVCRNEGGAANMAEAYGKLTGKPGVLLVTRGPGATNASIGVHTAFQDSTPMIVLIGQVARDQRDREAFQEVDYRRMFGQMAKWVAEIEDPARVPEYMSRAFQTALAGRPGPVVLALPEDMLTQEVEAPETRPVAIARPGAAHADLIKFRDRLARATNPLVMVGGGGWSPAATDALVAFAEANHLPVATAFRRQDCIDNLHPNYAGHVGIAADPSLVARVKDADPLIVIGPRLGEMTTAGYSLLTSPHPEQPLVHVHPSGEELNSVYAAELPIHADVTDFLQACAGMEPVDASAWMGSAEAAHAEFMEFSTPLSSPGEVDLGAVMQMINETLPRDAIVTNGAGNYSAWVHRFYRYGGTGNAIGADVGVRWDMGVPSGVAAALIHPGRTVVSFSGDGCFQMNCQELGTAVQNGAKLVFIVINNSMYGTIRMHQEGRYPHRISGTALVNPDFAKLCESYGGKGFVVTQTDQFQAALDEALACDMISLIEVQIEPDVIAPGKSLAAIADG